MEGIAGGIVFSSDDLGDDIDNRSRCHLWRERYSERYGRFDITISEDLPFSARSEFARFGAIGLGQHACTFMQAARTARHIAGKATDDFHCHLDHGASRVAIVQCDREALLTNGAMTLLAASEPRSVRAEQPKNAWCALIVPRKQLLDLVTNAEDLIATTVEPGLPALRHLARYLEILLGPDGVEEDPALLAHIGTTLLDLIALALGASRDQAAIARTRGLRAARVQEIIAEIKSGFADPSFSPIRVARKLGLSPRYVQDLLQESSTSFTERVLELRLQKARAMLADRRNDRLKVTDIAYACGFNHVPYFNRCFRARFGDSPTSFRGKPS
jgi:AraC-like DNA-binding protein